MLAEFKTPQATYVITNALIYQSRPQVIIRFNEITHIDYKENERGCDGKLMIYANNKSIMIHYRASEAKLMKQLIKEIKK